MPVLRLLLAIVLLAGPVLADTNADVHAHFKKGQMHYALGEFPEAISEFREAFRLKQEPAILFNLAQTYRQLHEWQHAYFHYRQYLIAKPTAPNRAEVEDFIEQMKNRMDEEDRAARADFNHKLDVPAAQSPPGVTQAPSAAVASSSSADTSRQETSPPGASAAQPARTAGISQPADVRAAPIVPSAPDFAVSEPPASSSSASSATPQNGQAPGTAVATPPAAATQSAPVVLAPQPIPAAAEPSQKPEFVETSPGPIVVEKHASIWRYTGYAAIGIGLVAGGVAYAMHSSAQSSADQFNSKYQSRALTAADTKLRDDSESKGKLATESLIAGIGLVATGAALTIAF